MKFSFKPADAAPVLASCSRVAASNPSLPILANIRVEARGDGTVELRATDYDVQIRFEFPAEVETAGVATVPAKTFSDLIASLEKDSRSGLATLSTTTKGARLRCRDTNAELQVMPVRDFPKRPDLNPEAIFLVSQAHLLAVLEKTLHAVPSKDPRKALLGALLTFKDDRLSVVGTDGKLLAFADMPVETAGREVSFILVRGALEEVTRHLGNSGTLEIAHDDKQVSFSAGNWTVTVNQIEGKYPNWEAVTPKEFEQTLEFPKAPVVGMLRRAGIFSDASSHAVVLRFEGDTLAVTAEASDKGQFRETVSIPDHGDYTVCVNRNYFGQALESIDTDTVVLKANEPTKPIVFRPKADTTDFYLIMPIKITPIVDPADVDDSIEEPEEVGADA